jgi:hypothetical protein
MPQEPSTENSTKTTVKPIVAPAGAKRTKNIDPDLYHRLRQESKSPYRGLRRFAYGGCAASAAIGAWVFLMKSIAGRDLPTSLATLAFQVGIVAFMVWLLKVDRYDK